MALKLTSFYFKFSWKLTIGCLTLLTLLVSLGIWQLHRAEEKRTLQAKFEARNQMAPLTLKQAMQRSDIYYQLVYLEGHFDNAHSFLLDNQFNRHRVGYQVITPFIQENDYRAILINRGWLPMGSDRALLYKIPSIFGKIRLQGFLYTPRKNPFIASTIESGNWPHRIMALDIFKISEHLNTPLYPWIILLDPQSPHGFVRDWQPVNMKASMHRGYAFQWFSMAMAVMIIYLNMSIKRKN